MTTEAEIRVIQPQAKECEQPQKEGAKKKSPRASEESTAPADTLISAQ